MVISLVLELPFATTLGMAILWFFIFWLSNWHQLSSTAFDAPLSYVSFSALFSGPIFVFPMSSDISHWDSLQRHKAALFPLGYPSHTYVVQCLQAFVCFLSFHGIFVLCVWFLKHHWNSPSTSSICLLCLDFTVHDVPICIKHSCTHFITIACLRCALRRRLYVCFSTRLLWPTLANGISVVLHPFLIFSILACLCSSRL